MSLKVISLWEPWATLMALSAKRIETRGWKTDFRGEVAIHSTKGGLSLVELKSTCVQPFFREALAPILSVDRRHVPKFAHGCIIAVGTLTDCCPTESDICIPGIFEEHPELDTPQERAFGNYEPDWYGLVFDNVSMLHEPVPFKSRQGKLLDLDYDTEQKVRAVWW